MTSLRSISYGGGVQSTAMLVLAAQGVIDFPLAIFANVGDDSEHPDSLRYVRDVAMPFAAANGIELAEVRRSYADGRLYPSLWGWVFSEKFLGQPLPAFIKGPRGNGLARRNCTASWKIVPIGKELRRRGATQSAPAAVAIGISTDEWERAGRGRDEKWEKRCYPLLDLGLSRSDCERVIAGAGLPVPGKSSCFFCPYTRPVTWREMRRDRPELFEQAVTLERRLNAREEDRGRPVRWYLSAKRVPLDQAVGEAPATLFGPGSDGGCDSGHCFT